MLCLGLKPGVAHNVLCIWGKGLSILYHYSCSTIQVAILQLHI